MLDVEPRGQGAVAEVSARVVGAVLLSNRERPVLHSARCLRQSPARSSSPGSRCVCRAWPTRPSMRAGRAARTSSPAAPECAARAGGITSAGTGASRNPRDGGPGDLLEAFALVRSMLEDGCTDDEVEGVVLERACTASARSRESRLPLDDSPKVAPVGSPSVGPKVGNERAVSATEVEDPQVPIPTHQRPAAAEELRHVDVGAGIHRVSLCVLRALRKHEWESIADDLRGIPDENQLSGRQPAVPGDRQPVDIRKVQDRTRQLEPSAVRRRCCP